MTKKAQGLSLNVIIVAAIALIVLIVLWAIFTGKMGSFTEGLQADTQKCKDLCSASGYPGKGGLLPSGTAAATGNECGTNPNMGMMDTKQGKKVCCCT